MSIFAWHALLAVCESVARIPYTYYEANLCSSFFRLTRQITSTRGVSMKSMSSSSALLTRLKSLQVPGSTACSSPLSPISFSFCFRAERLNGAGAALSVFIKWRGMKAPASSIAITGRILRGTHSDHPLIDYQPGSIRDTFDFGGTVLISTSAARRRCWRPPPCGSRQDQDRSTICG